MNHNTNNRCGAHRHQHFKFSKWAIGALWLAAQVLAPAQGSEPAPSGVPAPVNVTSRVLLQTTTTWAGQPLDMPHGNVEVTAMEIELAPGAETGWHSHPVPSLAYVLDGELEITLKDGRTQSARPGQALVEVSQLVHNGRNAGEGPVRLVVFYVAPPGTPLSHAAGE